jgi:hypothetical protein
MADSLGVVQFLRGFSVISKGMTFRWTIALTFVTLVSAAQEKVYLSGFVNDITTLQPLTYVNIATPKGKVLAATDQNGFFSVSTMKNDTLVFTRLGYQPYLLVASDNNWDERVFMAEMSKMLNEVTIYDRYEIHGSDEIKKGIHQDTRYNNFTMKPENQNTMIQTFGPSATFGAPWDKWTKDAREKKHLNAVLQEKERTAVYNEFIQSKVVEEYFIDTFNLDHDTYMAFKEGFIISNPDARYLTTRQDIIDLMVSYFATKQR